MMRDEIDALRREDSPRGDDFADAMTLCDCTCSDFGKSEAAFGLFTLAEMMWRERMIEWDWQACKRAEDRLRSHVERSEAQDRRPAGMPRKIEGRRECRARFKGRNR